jgi:uncharacterized membrane protein YbhN (UPF0104 family)
MDTVKQEAEDSAPDRGRWHGVRKWFLRLLKWGIVFLVLWAIRRTLVEAWNQVGSAQWNFAPQWLLLAGGVYLLGLLPAGIYWFVCLRRLGQRPGWFSTLRAYYVGGLGKYVPGKAMVIILRTGMIRGPGVHTAVAAASVFLETLTMMCVGAFLGAIFLAGQAWAGKTHPFLLAVAVALIPAALVPTLPPVFRLGLGIVLRRLPVGTSENPETRLRSLRMNTLAVGWLLMAALWFLWGASFLAVLKATQQVEIRWGQDLWPATASVALATVAGFAVLIVPGGIGVREAALAEIMVPLLAERTTHPELLAVVSAALLRLVWVLAELAVSAILMMMGPSSKSLSPIENRNKPR